MKLNASDVVQCTQKKTTTTMTIKLYDARADDNKHDNDSNSNDDNGDDSEMFVMKLTLQYLWTV